jgi:hypothetical protein
VVVERRVVRRVEGWWGVVVWEEGEIQAEMWLIWVPRVLAQIQSLRGFGSDMKRK